MHPLTKDIINSFSANYNPSIAAGSKAYLRNQFEFYGLQSPLRRELIKAVFKHHSIKSEAELISCAKEVWDLPERECQYAAIELIAKYKKLWTIDIISFFEYLITTKSWWDSVDTIFSLLLAPYFKLFPQQINTITGRWNKTEDNIWLQRSSIMFQKPYKKDTDTALLKQYILNCNHSKEFFIQKAIGWALREYAKTNPDWVKEFVANTKLAPLSIREALKHIGK